jgi:hypothetical protein
VGAQFEYAERLAAFTQRQQQIEDELDLTKSQAPSQLDAERVDSIAAAAAT